MTQWTDPSRTFLIQEIKNRKVIWDKDIANDTNHKMAKQSAFNEIAELMNETFSCTKFTGDDIRSQWKNLKDTFVRKLRYINEGKYAYDTQKEPTWKFYKMLSFLDDKKKAESISPDHPIFDIAALQRDHGIDLVRNELHLQQQFEHSNQSTASSEEQMLSLFAQYKEKTPAPPDTPPSPSLPRVSQPTPVRETIVASIASKTPEFNKCPSGSGDDEDEPRRKKLCSRRIGTQSASGQDEFDYFGSLVAAQLRRLSEEHSRSSSLRLQKKINDVLFDAQLELLEGSR